MVQINISGDNAAEALKDLSTLASALTGSGSVKSAGPETTEDTAAKKPTSRSKAKVEDKKVEVVEDDENSASLEEVQTKMKELLTGLTPEGDKAMRVKIKAVFADFGAVSTSTLKAADYDKVIEAFEALVDDLD